MASISGSTSSLSNTLQGYGGMASGIDRDSIIEQMTLGTTTKINNVKKDKTELQWKQEAYRSLSDKVIDLQDNYMTYSSDSNLKSSSVFAANQITAIGDEDATKYISATGTSAMLDSLSILGVKQTASAATVLSGVKSSNQPIILDISDVSGPAKESNLVGKTLKFGWMADDKWVDKGSFTFTTSYKKEYEYKVNSDGSVTCTKLDDSEDVTIDYTAEPEELVKQLNEAIWAESAGSLNTAKETIQFSYNKSTDSISISYKSMKAQQTGNGDEVKISVTAPSTNDVKINANLSSALTALGITVGDDQKEVAFADLKSTNFTDSYVENLTKAGIIRGKSVTVTYGGQSASITLLTAEELKEVEKFGADKNEAALTYIADSIQGRLDKAFGKGKVNAELVDVDGKKKLAFTTGTVSISEADSGGTTVTYGGKSVTIADATEEDLAKYSNEKAYMQHKLDEAFGVGTLNVDKETGSIEPESINTLTVNTSDSALRKELGLIENQSNRVSMSGTLWENKEVLGFSEETDGDKLNAALKNFSINGVSIEGITKDTTVNQLLSKINKSDAGVKASYLSGTGQFVLVADQTGTGRKINFNDAEGNETIAKTIFDGTSQDGRDAVMAVSYGNGVVTTMTSSTNTFNIEGVKVNVTGAFGYNGTKQQAMDASNEQWRAGLDSAMEVTFEAKADVEGVTEQVKKFVEEYNALVEEIYNQSTTRPDRDYGALTDEQKKEMSEKEIENWEKKAKEGLLFGDSNVRNLYSDLQNIVSKLMSNGVSYKDLESIGITAADSKADYGKLIFDESKFKKAMETDSQLVSNIFTGGGKVKKGLVQTIEDTLTPYATRYSSSNNGSYGFLVEEAGSDKLILSSTKNFIYTKLKEMDEQIKTLQSRLKSEQDRYIKQFTSMETMISQMNTQSGYLSQFSA